MTTRTSNGVQLRVALAGGGTGGHLVPGLNLLEHGVRSGRVAAVHWFLTGRPIEARVLGDLSVRLGVPATTAGLELEGRRGAPGAARQLVNMPRAVLRARRELVRFDADVLIGTGGFGSAPGVIAARWLGIPVVLLEVNARRGHAVQRLGPLARRVCHAMRGSLPTGAPQSSRHVFTGPPDPPLVPRRRGAPRLLVLGGSQGAGSLNTFIARVAPTLLAHGIEIVHQTGPAKQAEAGQAPRAGHRVSEYLDDVPGELAAATLVLCRGGASTLVEVAAAQLPAIVVPYPHHADQHQWHNALELGHGARIVRDIHLTSSDGASETCELITHLAGPSGAHDRDLMEAALARALPAGGSAAIFEAIDAVLAR